MSNFKKKMKVKFLPVVILILIQSLSFAQNGILKGKIIDAVTREPVPFAGVALQGTTTGTATDIDGNFVISDRKSTRLNSSH